MLGTVEGVVPAGVVVFGLVLPGRHGFATVAAVPLGRDGVAGATVEFEVLPTPLLVVEEVLPVVEAVPLGAVAVEVPALVLLEGVHGVTVVVVPV